MSINTCKLCLEQVDVQGFHRNEKGLVKLCPWDCDEKTFWTIIKQQKKFRAKTTRSL